MPQIFLIYIASVTFRSSGLLALAGVAALLTRNVAARHAVWTVSLGSVLLLPLADAVIPATLTPARIEQFTARPLLRFPEIGGQARPDLTSVQAARPVASFRPDWWRSALIAYVAVALLLLGRVGLGYWRILRLRRMSRPVESPLFNQLVQESSLRWRVPKLSESSSVRVPLTVGFLRPAVLLPDDWSSWSVWELRSVLSHELAHVRRADWATTFVAGVYRSLFWFNPLAWWLETHLYHLAEQASDEASLSLNGDPSRYAEVLLRFAAQARDGQRVSGGVAMARHNMRARINRILALQSPGSGVLKRAGWVLAIAAAMPALYTAAAMQNRQPQVVSSQTSVPRILKVPDPATQSEPIQPVPTLPTQNFSDAIRSAEQQLRSGFDQSQFLSDIAKQAQIEALSKINEAQIQQNLLLSDPHSMDFLTQTNPPEGLPPDVVLPPNSFAFYVGGTSNQALLWTNARSGGETVSFRRAEGTVWNAVSYDCQACSFFVNEAGIGPESLGGAGILFTMEDTNAAARQPDSLAEPHASGDLTLTCRAKECWAIPMSAWGTSTAARIRFDVVKLRTPIADQSRVLIIVTR